MHFLSLLLAAMHGVTEIGYSATVSMEVTISPAPVCRVLISRQTVVAGDGWLRTDAEWSINPHDPSAAQFSILDQLEEMLGRSSDGDSKFLFELYWPDLEGSPKGPRQMWKQTSNPVTGVPGAAVSGYEAVDAPYTTFAWGGLRRYGRAALLVGSSKEELWFYAVGSRVGFEDRIPGPSSAVSQTELYVHTPCASISPPPPSHGRQRLPRYPTHLATYV
jgi:hypothetical protein